MLAREKLMRLLALRDQKEVITIYEMPRNDVVIKTIVVCHKYFNLKIVWGFPKSFWARKLSFKPDVNRDELPALMWPNLS